MNKWDSRSQSSTILHIKILVAIKIKQSWSLKNNLVGPELNYFAHYHFHTFERENRRSTRTHTSGKKHTQTLQNRNEEKNNILKRGKKGKKLILKLENDVEMRKNSRMHFFRSNFSDRSVLFRLCANQDSFQTNILQ